MRRLHTPFEGFVGDMDMVLHVQPNTDDGWSNDAEDPSPDGMFETFDVQGSFINMVQHPLNPMSGVVRPVFVGDDQTWLAQASLGSQYLQQVLTNASVGWSMALMYDFSSDSTSSQRSIMEYSVTPAGTGANGWPMRLYWRPDSRDFVLEWRDGAGSTRSLTSAASLPPNGLIGLDVTRGNRSVDWYHNGSFVSLASRASNEVTAAIGTSASARFIVGGSVAQGSAYATPDRFMEGTIGDFAIWRGLRGEARHRALYGQSVRYWDENELLSTNNYRTELRVLVRNSTNTGWNDLAQMSDSDLVIDADIRESVDETTDRADVRLWRRLGELDDLSPLNEDSNLVDVIQLRRRIRIERAFVPVEHRMQGWEWDVRFEGLIDAFDIDVDDIVLECSDRSAALRDAFALDSRAYNYASPNKSSEDVQEEILTDFMPRIPKDSGTAASVGYRGEPSVPRIFTLAGTTATRHYLPSAYTLRYNDVSSGPVFDSLGAVTDQIGYATRYRFHEPWSSSRLTSYSPRRDYGLPVLRVSGFGLDAQIKFAEPHGLSLGSNVTVSGTSSLNFVGSVASVVSYYSVNLVSNVTLPGGSATAATALYSHNTALVAEQVLDVSPIKNQIGGIRNHAVVKFSRASIPDLQLTPTTIEVLGGIPNIALREEFSPTFQLDADSSGFSFRLEGGLGAAAALNGTYAGKTTGVNGGLRDISGTTPGGAADGVYTTSLPFLYTDWYRFKQVTSTATESVSTYGLLPVGVYEGTTLAINTVAEAQRLADALISDLSDPTADLTITTGVRPIELHDVISLPDDPKGRWRGAFNFAVTAILERHRSGQCQLDIDLRASRPTLGTAWADDIVTSPDRPAPIGNYPIRLPDQASASWRLQEAAKRARSMTFNRNRIDRREMGRRHDSTWVWMSTGSVGFMPTQDNLVGRFRGDNIQITNEANGNALSPGTTYFVKVAEQDIWGNLSEASGLGTATTATVFSVVPRFLTETAGALSVASLGASPSAFFNSGASTWQPTGFLGVLDGSDAAAVSFNAFGVVSLASSLSLGGGMPMFRMPCDGTVSVSHRSWWLGDPIKITTGTWNVWGRIVHARAGLFGAIGVVGAYNTDAIEGSATSTPFSLVLSGTVTARSGDWVGVQARLGASNDAVPYWESTASTNFAQTSFALVGQS